MNSAAWIIVALRIISFVFSSVEMTKRVAMLQTRNEAICHSIKGMQLNYKHTAKKHYCLMRYEIMKKRRNPRKIK